MSDAGDDDPNMGFCQKYLFGKNLGVLKRTRG